MSWTREELINWVLARIDEINPTGQTPEIGEILIGRELDEAGNQLLRSGRKQIVYPAGVSYVPEVFITQDANDKPRSIIIPLGSTFLRFLRLRMDFWNKAIDDVVSVDSNMYRRQFNPNQIATKNQPSAAIIPFQWTHQDESSASKTIDTAQNNADGTISILVEGAGGPHGYVVGGLVDIANVTGMPDVTGTHKVIYKMNEYIFNIAFVSNYSTGTGGTVRTHLTTANTSYKQAIEAFPAPEDFATAMGDYQLATGYNAGIATSKRMTLVKNVDLSQGKLPIVYECQVLQKIVAENLPDSLIDPVVWLAAGRCLTSLRIPDLANAAYANFKIASSGILVGLKGEEVVIPQPAQ